MVLVLVVGEVVLAELLLAVFFVAVAAGLVGDRYFVLTQAVVPFEWLYAILVNVLPTSNTSTASPYLSLPTAVALEEAALRTFTPDVAVQ